MRMKIAFLISAGLLIVMLASYCQQGKKHDTSDTTLIASEQRIEELLAGPPCLENFSRDVNSFDIEDVIIASGDIKLQGKLYLPRMPGPHPAIIYMHGGGNNYELIMSAPQFYAPRFAHCGYACLIYDERGTGQSGGVFHESTYDDFISDAGHAADFLAQHDQIAADKIGVFGGSQGGRLAPIVAARFPSVSFVISTSGPIGKVGDQATFNMKYALKIRGYEDTTIQQVMPLWEKHHKACESLNPDDLDEVAEGIFRMRKFIDPMALPNTYQEFESDSNLFFLKPMYSSMSKDYLTELAKLDVPWLAIYGEQDPVINVKESIENIQKQMASAQNHDCEIVRIKDVGHSFEYPGTRNYIRVEKIIVNWLNEQISNQ